jgi:hypothetical protein
LESRFEVVSFWGDVFGDSGLVAAFAPRISAKLLEALVRLDDRSVPIAEVNRRLGEEALRLGLTRPSYQRIRVLVHASRRIRRNSPTTASVLFEVAVRARPPTAVLDHLSGVGVPTLR